MIDLSADRQRFRFKPGGGPKDSGGNVDAKTVKTITVTANQAVELAETVHAAAGQALAISGFHGQFTPDDLLSLSCTSRPELVCFELIVMLAGDVAAEACRTGYTYGASDFVDEMRRLVVSIGNVYTEAVGRNIVFYWPTISLVD